METLNVAQLIGTRNAILQKFGLQVYERVKPVVSIGQPVRLDLSDLDNATTAFFHASVGNLYRDLTDKFSGLVDMVGLDKNPNWQDQFDEALEFARDPAKAREVDACISDLFA